MMKRFLLVLAVVMLLVPVFFYSDHKSTLPETPSKCDASCPLPKTIPTTSTLIASQENWSFVLPGDGWSSEIPSAPEIKFYTKNVGRDCLVMMLKELTDQTFAQYVIDTIKAQVEVGGTIASVKQVVIHDTKFILSQVNKNDAAIWTWITVNNGFGYGFSCGGDINPDAGMAVHDLCQEIAETLVL